MGIQGQYPIFNISYFILIINIGVNHVAAKLHSNFKYATTTVYLQYTV